MIKKELSNPPPLEDHDSLEMQAFLDGHHPQFYHERRALNDEIKEDLEFGPNSVNSLKDKSRAFYSPSTPRVHTSGIDKASPSHLALQEPRRSSEMVAYPLSPIANPQKASVKDIMRTYGCMNNSCVHKDSLVMEIEQKEKAKQS